MSTYHHELPQPNVANLDTISDLDASLDAKATHTPGTGLYPRDGTDSATYVESLLADVTICDQRLNVIWASGMSAVRETVNFAAITKAEQSKWGGNPTIAFAQDSYSQSTAFFEGERRKGVHAIRFDSGNHDDLKALIDSKEVVVFFAETVANTPEIPVLDVERLLAHIRTVENPPIMVLDNTLPLSTGLNFEMLLRPEDPVIVVESGTKNLMNNSELLGISYSRNLALMDLLRIHKARSGAVNTLGGLATISANLHATLPDFDSRNRAVFRSTNRIATALSEAQAELGDAADFNTIFPTHPDHPNHDLAQTMKVGWEPSFPSPVVFLTTANEWSVSAARDLTSRLVDHPVMREQIDQGQIHLGQSFGLPSARLLYDSNAPNVRFAGGYAIDDEALANAIKEAAADK